MKRIEQGNEARHKIHDVLLEKVDIALPESVVAAEIESHFQDGHDSGEEHRGEVEQEIRAGMKSQFVLDKIAEDAELTVGRASSVRGWSNRHRGTEWHPMPSLRHLWKRARFPWPWPIFAAPRHWPRS